MKRTIKVGNKELEFEASLGTADLYEILTGDNLLARFAEYQGVNDNDPRAYALMSVYKKMMFVMNTQAETDDIPTLRGKMTFDNYLAWANQFELTDVTLDVIAEVVKLWNDNKKSNSTPKNP